MQGTKGGRFVIAWEQIEVDGRVNSPLRALHVGSALRWFGEPLPPTGKRDVLVLGSELAVHGVSERAARQVQNMLRGKSFAVPDTDMPDVPPDQSFDITDGLKMYRALLLRPESGRLPLVLFLGETPVAGADYWVIRTSVTPTIKPKASGMICFVPGTLIDTPDGPKPVEQLAQGDLVHTRDNGAQPVMWTTRRKVSGARMLAMPELRPVQIAAELFGKNTPMPKLLVSPDHRLLIKCAGAGALFGTDEVLVMARDLQGLKGIRRDRSMRGVEYVHVMLEGHHVLRANGVDCESFHPASAALDDLNLSERAALDSLIPGVEREPHRFGAYARRLLSRGEAAIMFSDAVPAA